MKKGNSKGIFFLILLLVFINIDISYAYDSLRPGLDFSAKEKNTSTKRFGKVDIPGKIPKKFYVNGELNPYRMFEEDFLRGNITIDENTLVLFTGGGDVALNTQLAWLARLAIGLGWKVVAVRNGYEGMLADNWQERLIELTPEIIDAMEGLASTVLGSCRRKLKEEDKKLIIERFGKAKGIAGIGGNDHLKGIGEIAEFSEGDVKINGIGKSIDNDFWTGMCGYMNAVILGRRMAWWLANVPDGEVVVVEVMGRKSGSLALDVAKGCPVPYAVLIPEIEVNMDQVLDVVKNKGVKVLFVSEGVTFSKQDKGFRSIFMKDIHALYRYMVAADPKRRKLDSHGNPLLRGTSLYVQSALELSGLKAHLTSITYPTRGTPFQGDKIAGRTVCSDNVVSKPVAGKLIECINKGETGLVITWPIDYALEDGRVLVEAKPAAEVYSLRNVEQTYKKLYGKHWKRKLAEENVLGTEDPDFSPNKEFIIKEATMTKEQAAREAFYYTLISARTMSKPGTPLVSCVEMGLPDETIIKACGRIQPGVKTFERPLRMIIETTRKSVIVLTAKKYVSFEVIANEIKKAVKANGYAGIALSKDFRIDIGDPLFLEVLKNDPVLNAKFRKFLKANPDVNQKFLKDRNIARGVILVSFDHDVSKFIRGLCNLIEIGAKRTNLDYAFENLQKGYVDTNILEKDELLAQYGVLGSNIGIGHRNIITRRDPSLHSL